MAMIEMSYTAKQADAIAQASAEVSEPTFLVQEKGNTDLGWKTKDGEVQWFGTDGNEAARH